MLSTPPTCSGCKVSLAMQGMTLCPLCADRKRHADEAAYCAAAEARYEEARTRMATIGSAAFVPCNDEERRMHRALRRKINFA